jgi:hypothetical protein
MEKAFFCALPYLLFSPILGLLKTICERNLAFMGDSRKSTIQLGLFPLRVHLRVPDRLRANTALDVQQQEASTDRSPFVAITAWPDMTNSEDYAGSI